MLQRIVVGYDYSEPSDDALGWAMDLARSLGSRVLLAYVLDARSDDDPALNEAREKLARVADELGPEAQSHVIVGKDVADSLVRFCEESNADAIVLSTAGFGGVARFLLGSVADAVVRSARCPVITLRHERV